jgi:5'-nucleotidase
MSNVLILVTNDDGVRSPGIRSLAQAMADLGRVVVVAPDRNRSAVGHALTLEDPLRVDELKTDVYAVDGTPTDCVNLGIHGLLQQQPDLVISGINRGSNVGDDITYSGTVSAAMEACLMGVQAFAVSLEQLEFSEGPLATAAQFARRLARQVLEQGLPQNTFLNVNVPAGPCRGVELTRQGKRQYGASVIRKQDPRGRYYYWLGGADVSYEDIPGSDCNALQAGFISVTPLKANLTHEQAYNELRDWPLQRMIGNL